MAQAGPSNTRVAVISSIAVAVATLAGSISGGLVANKGATAVQRAEADRAEDREAAAARGAARLLVRELRDAEIWMEVALQYDAFLRLGKNYPISISTEDQETIAARLKPKEWETLESALSAVGGFQLMMDETLAAGRNSPRLGKEERDGVEGDAAAVQAGAQALRRLAASTPVDPRPLAPPPP